MYKYIVCTMYCGEPDLPFHIKSLSEQGVIIDHRIFSFMSEIDAHNAVYQTLGSAGPEWIRAKIDADVVLQPGKLKDFGPMISRFSHLVPVVHDFFTDEVLGAGVSLFGPGVTFKIQTDPLKCDRNIISKSASRSGMIGHHCHYANEYTAFHYGFHRGLKSQLPVYNRMIKAHSVHGDRIRLMAIRGFNLAQSDRYKDWHLGISPVPDDHNYGPKLEELFKEFCGNDPPLLTRTWR